VRALPDFSPADTIGIAFDGTPVSVPDFSRFLTITYSAPVTPDSLVSTLNGLDGVVLAEPDFPIEILSSPDDPFYEAPPPGYSRWHLDRIGMPSVWNANTLPDPTWRVCVLDSGVKWQHPDFGSGWGATYKIYGGHDYVSGSADFSDRDAEVGSCTYHGTNVCGLLGAVTNNGVGVASVAGGWYPQVLGPQLVVFRVTGEDGGICKYNPDSLSKALLDATDFYRPYNCQIISGSIGKTTYYEQGRAACIAAYKRGALLVFARGNGTSNDNDSTAVYPACYDNHCILSCGASDTADVRLHTSDNQPRNTYYKHTSRFGTGLDLVAPGHRLSTVYWDYYNGGQPAYNGDFGATSGATPLVAGAAALLKVRGENHVPPYHFASEDLQELLKMGCTDIAWDPVGGAIAGRDRYTGAGRLDVAASLAYLESPYLFIQPQSDPVDNYTYGYPTDTWGDYRTFLGIAGLPEEPAFVYVTRIRNTVQNPVGLQGPAWGVGRRSTGASLADPNYCEGYCELEALSVSVYNGKTYNYHVYLADSLWGVLPRSIDRVVMGYSAVGTGMDPSTVDESGSSGPGTGVEVRGSPGQNPTLVLGERVAAEGMVQICDVSGRQVRAIRGAREERGLVFRWDGRNNRGVRCAGGVYFAEGRAGRQAFRKRLVLTPAP
jgi:subtilisin family serine protease